MLVLDIIKLLVLDIEKSLHVMILYYNCLNKLYSGFPSLVLTIATIGVVGMDGYFLVAVDGNSHIVWGSAFLSCSLHVEDSDHALHLILVKFQLSRGVQSLMHY